ncbi:MAG: hypothetical protein PHR35_22870 [Kiritimatiellae bacterium]|nr:hypothetical protein [Kiritimatiellia bacterium]
MAETRLVAELLPDLTTDLPGCTEADMLAELEWAARELCKRSRCWRKRASIAVEAGAASVGLDTAACGGRVLIAELAEIDGAAVRESFPDLAWGLVRDDEGCQSIEFDAAPVSEDGEDWTLTVDLTLAPGRGGDVAAWIVTDFGEAIQAGARARLKRQKDKPYTDYRGADLAEAEWRRGVAEAACAGAQAARRERE